MKKRVKVKERSEFENNVFGGECFCNNYPGILTTGVDIELMPAYGEKWWFIMHEGKPVSDTAFFTKADLQYLEEIV
jgi:hypothetical protein